MADGSQKSLLDDKLMNEKLKTSLRKMIKSFDNYIKDASNFEQLEDNLKHMEETDEKFHKYDLVEILRDKIDSSLGEPIEKTVHSVFFNANKFDIGDIDAQNKLAQSICNDIKKTKEFQDFKHSFKSNVIKVNDHLMKNFNTNFVDTNSDELAFADNENKSLTLTSEFDYLSLDNSMNQVVLKITDYISFQNYFLIEYTYFRFIYRPVLYS
jgi:hypothetical protein